MSEFTKPLPLWNGQEPGNEYTVSGFRVYLWYAGPAEYGKERCAYQFYDDQYQPLQGRPVFGGADLVLGAGYHVDGPPNEAFVDLLSFLSLQEGDTDDEFFERYTTDQLAWRDSGRAEELSLVVSDLEEGIDPATGEPLSN